MTDALKAMAGVNPLPLLMMAPVIGVPTSAANPTTNIACPRYTPSCYGQYKRP